MPVPLTFTETDNQALRQWSAEGVAINEMARRLGKNRSTVLCHLRRGGHLARKTLDDVLAENGIGGSDVASRPRAAPDLRPDDVREEWWKRGNRVVYDDGHTLEFESLWEHMLVFSCTQSPFNHKDYLAFLAMVVADVRPNIVIMLGDLADMKFAKPEFGHPDDMSPNEEIEQVREFVAGLKRITPEMICLTSNHGEGRMAHMQKRGAVPSAFIRQYQDVFGMPKTWITRDYVIARNWVFEHGHDVSKGSRTSIREEMIRRFQRPLSVMRAHRHNLFGEVMAPEWETPTQQRRLCYVGCGMDDKEVRYTRSGLWNGAIYLYRGVPIPMPMERDRANRFTGRLVPW